MFCVYLRTNSDLCHLQHKLIGFYNRDEKCLLRGRDWVFKQNSLRFVFKGLILLWTLNMGMISYLSTLHYICKIEVISDLCAMIGLLTAVFDFPFGLKKMLWREGLHPELITQAYILS